MSVYDDDLKLFLTQTLESIDYLSRLTRDNPQILAHLGFCMEARFQEAGEHLFRETEPLGSDELVIVYNGMIDIYTIMDDGTEFPLESLPKGSVINAHQFIATRPSPISAKMACNTTYYTLSVDQFARIAREYPRLRKIYNNLYSSMLSKKDRDIQLDYQTPSNVRI